MTTLDAILDAQPAARQLTIDEYLALDSDGCEFEPLCQQELAAKRKPGAKPPAYPHRCGWLDTSILWCPKRRHYLSLKKTGA